MFMLLRVNMLDPWYIFVRALQMGLRPFKWAGSLSASVGIKYDELKARLSPDAETHSSP